MQTAPALVDAPEASAETPRPGGRDSAVDLARAAALVRVVSYHAVGLPYVMTWFSAMPLMFFIAGYFMEASLDREGPVTCIRRRYVRVLLPLFPYAVMILSVFAAAGLSGGLKPANVVSYFVPLLSFPGPTGPVAMTNPLSWTFMGLWYLQNYMLLVLISPVLRWGMRRVPWATVGLVAVFWVVSLQMGIIGRFPTYMAAWVFGMAVFRYRSIAADRRLWAWIFGIAITVGTTVFVLYTGPRPTGVGSRWVVLSVLLLGLAWIAGLLAFRPWLTVVADRPSVAPVVRWLNARAVSVYLWHFAAFGISAYVARECLGSGWSVAHGALSLALAATLTFVFATAFGWLEDVAARRRPVLIPGLRVGRPRSARRTVPAT